jgi:O-antigen/teichoic acid export membrane protein
VLQIKSLVKDISIYGISELLNRSVQVLFLPLIFAFLSTTEFGTLDLFLSAKNILAAIFGWGIITAVQRYGGVSDEKSYTLEQVISSSIIVVLVVYLFLGILFLLLYCVLIQDEILSFIIILLISLFYGLRSVVLGVLRLKHRAKEFLIVTLINIIIYLFGTFFLLKYSDLSYVSFFIAGLAGILVSCFMGLYFIRKHIKIDIDITLTKSIFNFGASLLSTSLIVIFVATSNRFSLSLFGNTMEEVGVFGMSNRLSLFVGALLVAPFTLAWLPFVNENYFKDNYRQLVSIVFKTLVIIGLNLTIILMIIGYPVLTYLDESGYVNSMKIVPFFCISYIFQAGYFIFSSSFYINKQNKLYVRGALFVFFFNIITLALIIPITNYITVSIVTMLTYLFQMIYAFVYADGRYKIEFKLIINITILILIHVILFAAIIYGYEQSMNIISLIIISITVMIVSIFAGYVLLRDVISVRQIVSLISKKMNLLN